MFDPVDSKQSFPALEEGILQYWREEDMFRRSVHARRGRPVFSFYDGPPFATGLPHYGHLLAGTIKDVIPRYQTMRGRYVERRFGWDCHGLPVEVEVEKEQGIQSRRDTEAMGIKTFNAHCRRAVQRFTREWRAAVERLGRWVDMDWDYRTMDPDYMESIWWVFKELHHRKLLYEGRKPMHVCPRCTTPLSNFEVTLGYKEVEDLGVTAKFLLEDAKEQRTYLLAWTTTPWTLPGNLFLAINKDTPYLTVQHMDEHYVIARDRVETIFAGKEYKIAGKVHGKDLLGKRYAPLFPYFAKEYGETGYCIVDGSDFVTTEDGTGVVHIAPGFGEDDFNVWQRRNRESGIGNQTSLPLLQHVTMDGHFTDAVTDFAEQEVKPAGDPQRTDRAIAQWLECRELLFAQHPYRHSYPHCWRCDSPLLNYATSSWFVAVEKIKENMLQSNAQTQWVPAHIRDGRFGKWIAGARDWAISRNRYWGTPLPVWRCVETGDTEVIGSRDQLMQRCPQRFTKVTVLRHGESEGNVIPIYQGTMPGTDLTARGRAQAEMTAEALRTQTVETIYASPLARTQQTAAILASATGARVVTDERLREIAFGEYEGRSVDFSDLTFVKARRAKKIESNRPESIYHLPGMEPWESSVARTSAFLREALPRHRGAHIVIVSHADPVQTIRHFFMQEDPVKISHQPYPDFASPYSFFWDHDAGAQLDLHKDTVDTLTWTDRQGRRFARIPEVLDCWFESGAMPYASAHFPFKKGEEKNVSLTSSPFPLPQGFPADFIAEGIDQTRGWFYTLMVLATALFGKPAFRNCIVNGIVLAEDGRKMSKRLKNYPEPLAVARKHGADALRYALMHSPAVRGEDLRFSETKVEEAVRTVLLPLWNSYSFFVTYANAARFTPAPSRRASPHPLDRWIRAEVQDLTNRMTQELDAYDLSATCEQLQDTIDALTNWYIRLSRRRFAGKGSADAPEARIEHHEEGQHDALATLHTVLLTVAQLLAPFCPFLTEAIYLNLSGEEHGSVHLTDWPTSRALAPEEEHLLARQRLLRRIASLGMRVRAQAQVKVRQPLARATAAIPPEMLKSAKLTTDDCDLLRQEINVKEFVVADDPGALGRPIAVVDPRRVGPRLGSRVQALIAAGKRGDFIVREDGMVLILDETLGPEDVRIVYEGAPGHEIAAQDGIVVAVETDVSPTLEIEGHARDLVRVIQNLRQKAGLKHTDRIVLQIEGADRVLRSHGTFIAQETNAVLGETRGAEHTFELDGMRITMCFTSTV